MIEISEATKRTLVGSGRLKSRNLEFEIYERVYIVGLMNSRTFRKAARIGRFLSLLVAVSAAGFLLSGCGHMRQYSIDSWQGPMPLEDHHYLQSQLH